MQTPPCAVDSGDPGMAAECGFWTDIGMRSVSAVGTGVSLGFGAHGISSAPSSVCSGYLNYMSKKPNVFD